MTKITVSYAEPYQIIKCYLCTGHYPRAEVDQCLVKFRNGNFWMPVCLECQDEYHWKIVLKQVKQDDINNMTEQQKQDAHNRAADAGLWSGDYGGGGIT